MLNSAEPAARGPRILVVDDDPRYVELVVMMLEAENFDVCHTIQPRNVLDLAVAEQPDLILMDLSMPQMDGIEVALMLRGDPRTANVPVAFFTARSTDVDRLDARAVGAVEYLMKPMAVCELSARLHQILDNLGKGKEPHACS